jgi:hypothetical protein
MKEDGSSEALVSMQMTRQASDIIRGLTKTHKREILCNYMVRGQEMQKANTMQAWFQRFLAFALDLDHEVRSYIIKFPTYVSRQDQQRSLSPKYLQKQHQSIAVNFGDCLDVIEPRICHI